MEWPLRATGEGTGRYQGLSLLHVGVVKKDALGGLTEDGTGVVTEERGRCYKPWLFLSVLGQVTELPVAQWCRTK